MGFFKEHAQDGRGIKRPAKRASEFLSSWAERSRALCAFILTIAFATASHVSAQSQLRAASRIEPFAQSPEYQSLQRRLARGWNTWDVNSVTTHVLLPEGLAIHLSLKHNSTLYGDALLTDALIGRLSKDAEQVFPGPHAWDGSYTDLRLLWKGHSWRVQSAHVGDDLVLLTTPLASQTKEPLSPSIVFSVNFLWNKPGTVTKLRGEIETHSPGRITRVYCTCEGANRDSSAVSALNISPLTGPYFAADLVGPVAVTTGKRRSLSEVQSAVDEARVAYEASVAKNKGTGPIVDAIETTLGWDTIFEPEKGRVVSPVSRVWSVGWGGYVIFDWDTFFAATLATVGDQAQRACPSCASSSKEHAQDGRGTKRPAERAGKFLSSLAGRSRVLSASKDLAYANAVETLREETAESFVPNYARAGNWKSFDRSEPPVGAITVLGLYQQFGDRWLLKQTFPALLKWNNWWSEHRDVEGYLSWGSDGQNPPGDLDDSARGTREGAILESGLDNSPMYDDAVYDSKSHVLQFADVGLMSMYVADCDALAEMADVLGLAEDARTLRERSEKYRNKLQTLWSTDLGIFLNKDLRTGQFSKRLSPTNFYPMLAHAATREQAQLMVKKHLLNPEEFWGEWVLPSIARNDPAFKDQNYWRGRIWGPMNYLVYLGLRNYNLPEVRSQFADKSYALFLKEWREHGHVHENYNAILGVGDDVPSSDRFYHWGALLGYVKYLEEDAKPR